MHLKTNSENLCQIDQQSFLSLFSLSRSIFLAILPFIQKQAPHVRLKAFKTIKRAQRQAKTLERLVIVFHIVLYVNMMGSCHAEGLIAPWAEKNKLQLQTIIQGV